MDLIKCIIEGNYSSTFYRKKGDAVNPRNCSLLGFRSSIPVLSSTMLENKSMTLNSKKAVTVNVNSQSGEKFITLNGKKFKMVPEKELPPELRKNSKMVKVISNNGIISKKQPVKVKIVGTIPSSLINGQKIIKYSESENVEKNVIKSIISKTDSQISHTELSKTLLIKDNKIATVKKPSTAIYWTPLTTTDTFSTQTKSHQATVPLCEAEREVVVLNKLQYAEVKTYGSVKNRDLNSMKQSKPNVEISIKKCNKSSQTDKNHVDVEVQTDLQYQEAQPDSSFENELLKLDFRDLDELLGSIPSIQTPQKTMCFTQSVSSKNLCSPNSTVHVNNETRFFLELRSALLPDDEGNMPIHVGVLNKDVNSVIRSCFILKVLQQSVDIINNGDLTPLQLAVINDVGTDIIKILLENFAKLNTVDSEGNTVLHLAIEYRRTQALEALLEFVTNQQFSLNLNQYNHEGLTPLMICSISGILRCAELLLKYDADVNLRDQISGRTALFHAVESHNQEMVQLLLYYNADTKIKNFFGTSPHDAVYEVDEIPEVIKTLILSRTKRKANEEFKLSKVRKKEELKKPLKTYARFQKINHLEVAKTLASAK